MTIYSLIISQDLRTANEMLAALKDTDVYLPTLLAIGLGLRRGEVLGLQWKDLDFDKKLVSVRRTLLPKGNDCELFSECKTEKSHRILAVPENIISFLKQAKKGSLKISYSFQRTILITI